MGIEEIADNMLTNHYQDNAGKPFEVPHKEFDILG